MIDSNYFLVALLPIGFVASFYSRLIIQFTLHFIVFSIVSVSSVVKEQGRQMWKMVNNTIPFKKFKTMNKIELEESAIELWNVSIASKVVEIIIVPLSFCAQVGIMILIFKYVIANSPTDNSGPFNLLGSNTIADISVVNIVLQIIFILAMVYTGYRMFQAFCSWVRNWSLWSKYNLPLPASVMRCIDASRSKIQHQSGGSQRHRNFNNHPALGRLFENQFKQDLQQENFSSFIDTIMRVIGMIVFVLMLLTSLNVDTTPIWGALAIGGTAAALASYTVLSNLLGTFNIFYADTHRVGDMITLNLPNGGGGQMMQMQGEVDKIGPLNTFIWGYDGNYTIVPNGYFVTNVARVWRQNEMHVQQFNFIFGGSITYEMFHNFEFKFQNIVLEYPEINGNESYIYLVYGDFSTARFQVVLTKNEKTDFKGPAFLYNMANSNQGRAGLDPLRMALKYKVDLKKQKDVAKDLKDTKDNASNQKKSQSACATSATVLKDTFKNSSKDTNKDIHISIRDAELKEDQQEEVLEQEEGQERIKEQVEAESKGKRQFFVATRDVYLKLHTWCIENNYPQITTSLYN